MTKRNKNKIESPFRPLLWFMALLLSVFVAACGGGGGDGTTTTPFGPASVIPGVAGSPGAAATNPTVISASPGSGATNVATSTNGSGNIVTGTLIVATFGTAMNPATIISPTATFPLRNITLGTAVAGAVTMNPANTVATFTPAAPLNLATNYTATVSTAARNAGGTAIPNPVVWSFSTAGVLKTVQLPVNLLSVETNNFVILTGTGITNTGSHLTAITGNIGASGITAAAMDDVFCTEIAGTIYGKDAGFTGSGATGCFAGNFVDLHAGVLGGKALVPGLYKYTAGVLITSDVTLSGGADDVWIFQIAADITQGPGAKAKNIFWQVDGGTGVALDTTAVMEGTILTLKAITMNTGSKITGRLLAQTTVTLDATTVTAP